MFNELKTTMMAMEFLERAKNKTMSYMKLIKLMYLADRRVIELHNKRISYDTYYNMKNGVILSDTLYTMREAHKPHHKEEWSLWDYYIRKNNTYNLKIRGNETKINVLSEKELEVIEYISTKYGDMDVWDLIDNVIHKLSEWEHPNKKNSKSVYLELNTILDCIGKNKDDKREINVWEQLYKTDYEF